jgi:hypothetical protein
MNQNPSAAFGVAIGVTLYVALLGAIIYFSIRWSRRRMEEKAAPLQAALAGAGARFVADGPKGGLYEGQEREYDYGGRHVFVGAWYVSQYQIRANLRVATAERLPWVAIFPEGSVERLGKAIGLNREVQTGDAAFDDAAYVDTVEDDAPVQRLLENAALRDAARELIAHGYKVQLSERGVEAYEIVGTGQPVDGSRTAVAVGHLGVIADALPSFEGRKVKGKTLARMAIPTVLAVWVWVPAMLLAGVFGGTADETLDKGPAVAVGLAFGGACWLVYCLALALSVRGRSYAFRVVLLGAALGLLGVPALGGTALHWLNQRLDTSAAEVHPATILRLSNDRSDHYAHVLSWRPDKDRERIGVTHAVYGRLRAGQTIRVRVHRGAFGWAWVEKVTGE